VAAGASHFDPAQAATIGARCDATLGDALRRLSGEFLGQLDADYRRLNADPRVAKLVRQADAAIQQNRPAPQIRSGRGKRQKDAPRN
jgi:hypothetical protein